MADRFPPDIDMDTPDAVRMYDYLLGGKDNFEADRKACDALLERVPELFTVANEHRSYIRRATEYVASRGVEQFLVLGAGLPSANVTHLAVRAVRPTARVVYVGDDPVVLAHGRALATDGGRTAFVLGGPGGAERALDGPEVLERIDPGLPVCVTAGWPLRLSPRGDDPFEGAAALLDRLPPGSHAILSHGVCEDRELAAWMDGQVRSALGPGSGMRCPGRPAEAFGGSEAVGAHSDGRDTGPRVVDCATWRHPERSPLPRPADPAATVWEAAAVVVRR
ncbi:SAM-dependent methyltransferase [Nocardiopsis sp. LOL_012]|uniref:SAM-dependent methyltransferase n=1 Tax=Nocardiopsis sp. LOL_012 TaxID=3345409 RepID=UPI003A86A898